MKEKWREMQKKMGNVWVLANEGVPSAIKPVALTGAMFYPRPSPLFRPSRPSRIPRLDRHSVPFYGARF